MGRLTTHVLDTALGQPARGVKIELHRLGDGKAWTLVATLETNADGRTGVPVLTGPAFETGAYQLTFHIGAYFRSAGVATSEPPFPDEVVVRFSISETDGHYHVPLLASPWSYTTYRGS